MFVHFGVPLDDARQASDVLAASDLSGIDSHGVARLHAYFEMLELGRINPKANVRVIRELPGTATVDGDNGLAGRRPQGERDRHGQGLRGVPAGLASAIQTISASPATIHDRPSSATSSAGR